MCADDSCPHTSIVSRPQCTAAVCAGAAYAAIQLYHTQCRHAALTVASVHRPSLAQLVTTGQKGYKCNILFLLLQAVVLNRPHGVPAPTKVRTRYNIPGISLFPRGDNREDPLTVEVLRLSFTRGYFPVLTSNILVHIDVTRIPGKNARRILKSALGHTIQAGSD